MENKSEKRIDIRVQKFKTYVEVSISDNGKGIGKEDEGHIFQPYFTTKSKGTGLGLAIVKNLMTESGGDIRFVSEKGTGTTFILRFPLATGNKL
jgi:signal transduction histidine kinase